MLPTFAPTAATTASPPGRTWMTVSAGGDMYTTVTCTPR